MFPVDSIVQMALLTFFVILVFLVFVFSMLLAGSAAHRNSQTENEAEIQESDEDDAEEDMKLLSRQQRQPEPEEEPDEPEEIPIYEKYPQIYRFEILYWRGISKPWWWNNYARELYEYANEYFPKTKVNLFIMYNSNSKGEDYNSSLYHRRILSLRPRKISKHPLVVINYSEEFHMIDSHYALEEMMDRIDAEWYRHFHFKKTYRNSPVSFQR